MIDYYKVFGALASKHPRRNAATLSDLANEVVESLRSTPTINNMVDGITMLCLLAENPSDVRTAKAACRLAEELDAAINKKVLQVLNLNDRTGVELYCGGDDDCEVFRVDD